MKFSYDWLKWYIPDSPKPNELADVLTRHLTEVEGLETLENGDTVLDVNILPNRAHDLLSHKGLALEISGQLGIGFVEPASHYEEILAKKEISKTDLVVSVESPDCIRYTARIIRNIKIGPSPDWVVKHLESIGQRSINNIVDATNLVMYNCGQPMHAFDLRKFSDSKIIIKNALNEEELELVGREKIVAKLKDSDLVVANSAGETLGLVGVKGGVNSGIQDDTTDIILEAANFAPVTIRKTARRVGALSDAAKRFENGLTPELTTYAMLEITALICEMFPDAVVEEIADYYPNKQEEKVISFTAEFVNKKLGSSINDAEIEKILQNYKYEYKKEDSNFIVTVPVFRLDLETPIDFAEEIGRIYGYDKLNPVLPNVLEVKTNDIYSKISEIRTNLISTGYREVVTYSFTKKGDVQVARGVKGKDFLRTNLIDGLKDSYELNKNNAPLLMLDDVKLFEIGTVFKDGNEEIHVAYINRKESKEVILNDFVPIGTSSESFPEVLGSPRDARPDHPSNLSDYARTFVMWSIFPFITRDIAVWVPADFDKKALENIYNSAGGELLAVPAYQVDEFSKDGKKSYAFRLVFQSKERTLEADEVAKIVEKINSELTKIEGLELR